jgi:hypothetical protein
MAKSRQPATIDQALLTIVRFAFPLDSDAGTKSRDELLRFAKGTIFRPIVLPGFGVWGWPYTDPERRPLEQQISVDVLLVELRSLLSGVISSARDAGAVVAAHGGNATVSSELAQITVDVGLTSAAEDPGRHMLMIRGGARDVFLAVILQLLAQGSTAKIRECPECKAIFYRIRRQTHCSPKCYDAWYWRQYPAAKKRSARKTQYDKHGWTEGARARPKVTSQTKGR